MTARQQEIKGSLGVLELKDAVNSCREVNLVLREELVHLQKVIL